MRDLTFKKFKMKSINWTKGPVHVNKWDKHITVIQETVNNTIERGQTTKKINNNHLKTIKNGKF